LPSSPVVVTFSVTRSPGTYELLAGSMRTFTAFAGSRKISRSASGLPASSQTVAMRTPSAVSGGVRVISLHVPATVTGVAHDSAPDAVANVCVEAAICTSRLDSVTLTAPGFELATRTTTGSPLRVTSDMARITAPSSFTAGSGYVVLMPAGSVIFNV
jgi:hypothetical protein